MDVENIIGVEGKHLGEVKIEEINRVWLKHYDEWVRPSLEYPEIPLFRLLEDTARTKPENTAIVFFGKEIAYRELDALSNRLANYLKSLGIKKGDGVILAMPNIPQYVVSYYAVLKAGGIVVQANPIYTEREFKHIASNSEARVAIILDQIFDNVYPLKRDGLVDHIILAKVEDYLPFPLSFLYRFKKKKVKVPAETGIHEWKAALASEELKERPEVNPKEDIAVHQYTGGTTGFPKAAMLTHYNLVANVYQTIEWIPGKGEGDVFLGALPYFHVFGMTTSMNAPVAVGAPMILVPDPRDIKRVIQAIDKYRVSIFCGVPTLFNAILNYPDLKKYDLSSLKACISGAAPLPVELKRSFEKETGSKLIEGYGLSETSPVTHGNPFYGLNKEGSIGIPFPDTYALVIDEEGKVLPVGEIGELAIYGPQVMKGYYKMEEETRKTLVSGWLLTGDMAKMDEDGYFYIVDRKKDVIIAGGYNIYPREVEEVLYEHPAVLEAAVVGVPDKYRGETVKAFIVLRPEHRDKVTEKDIEQFCRQKLAAYKVPRIIEFVDELPKSAVGKVLRRVLRDQEVKKMEQS
ncbi:long-chain fatty acid--CoA ligase [Geoglobus acetivorans]|uniref:Long-chain fatty acid--CoA ligase n=1 Tax=Geoglobus acetivorans TaxID=565033 RepID=A0ABZ3H1F8_GEOAI